MVRYLGPHLPPPSDANPSPSPYWRADRAPVATRFAGVRHGWGPGDRPRVCRLYGKAPPCILSARLMVSLPVHVSCFDLYIVNTNMSGVTPSPPFSRLVLELLEGILLFGCDTCPPSPSALLPVREGPRWCSVPSTCEYPILCPLSQGMRTDFGAQGSVNDPIICEGGGRWLQSNCSAFCR